MYTASLGKKKNVFLSLLYIFLYALTHSLSLSRARPCARFLLRARHGYTLRSIFLLLTNTHTHTPASKKKKMQRRAGARSTDWLYPFATLYAPRHYCIIARRRVCPTPETRKSDAATASADTMFPRRAYTPISDRREREREVVTSGLFWEEERVAAGGWPAQSLLPLGREKVRRYDDDDDFGDWQEYDSSDLWVYGEGVLCGFCFAPSGTCCELWTVE